MLFWIWEDVVLVEENYAFLSYQKQIPEASYEKGFS